MSFLSENHKNDNQGAFPDFYEFTLYMTFVIFPKMFIPIMAIFLQNFKNHKRSEFVEIQQFHPSCHFRDFASKMTTLIRLEIENFEISLNSVYILRMIPLWYSCPIMVQIWRKRPSITSTIMIRALSERFQIYTQQIYILISSFHQFEGFGLNWTVLRQSGRSRGY